MSTPPPDLYERLLASLADDTPADWGTAHGARSLDSLRELARIADFHRELQRGDGGDAPHEWGTLLLLERIGRGTRGEVWRAWDRSLRREVALKLVSAGALGTALAEAALLEEARAAARVSHPNIVVVHGVARHGEHAGLWMEYVRGASLAARVHASGPLPAREAVALAADVAGALAALHAAGVLHRDVKPANLLCAEDGHWVLADFGLGVSRDRRDAPAPAAAGTPMFLAPELFAGAPLSAASDQYALALTLWFALTGRDALAAGSLDERAALAARPEPPRLAGALAGADPALAAIVEQALAPDPERRHAGAKAFEQALRGWLAGTDGAGLERPARTFAWLALVAVPAVVLVAMLVLRRWTHERAEAPPAAPPAARPPPAPTT
ncbi:MAG: serine/threonine-protein kinase [Candidatus Eisenbacteria bacterium]